MFYERLKELCRENGTTITAFALEAGCNRSTPTGWKNGSVPGADIVVKAARRFSVSADYLLGLTDDPRREPSTLTPEELILIRSYRAAPPILRAAAQAVLSATDDAPANL